MHGANRQHHVAKFYLKGWAKNGYLYYLENGISKRVAARKAGQQHQFYAAKPLGALDLKLIKWSIENSPPTARKVHEATYKMLAIWHQLLDFAQTHQPYNQVLIEYVHHQIVNYEENYHSRLESRNAPIIEALRGGDASFYEDDKASIHFLHFLCLQIFRTKAVKEQMVDGMRAWLNTLRPDDPWRALDPAAGWNIQSHILAVNVGQTLYVGRHNRRLLLLDNATDVEFITGDMPVVNLSETAAGFHSPYYPLSPTKALALLDPADPNPPLLEPLTTEIVDGLNRNILRSSFTQAYASDRETFSRYR